MRYERSFSIAKRLENLLEPLAQAYIPHLPQPRNLAFQNKLFRDLFLRYPINSARLSAIWAYQIDQSSKETSWEKGEP